MKKIKDNLWLLAIILGGTAIRVIYWLATRDHTIFGDGGTHTLAGLAIARTITHHFSPDYFANFIYNYWATMGSLFFYPRANDILATLSFLLFGFSHLSARLPAMAFSILVIFAVYLLGQEIFGKKIGLWSALFAAINPYFIHFGGSDLVDVQMACLATLAVFFCLRAAKSNQTKYFLLAGLFAGLAGLMKPPGFIVIVPMIFIIIYHKNLKYLFSPKFLALIATFILLVFSYFGLGLILKLASSIVSIQTAAASDILHWFGSALTFAEAGDPTWRELAGWTYYLKILPEQLGWLSLIFAIVGAIGLWRAKNNDKKIIIFANIIFIYLAFVFLDNKNDRYTMLYLPFLCVLAGIGIKTAIGYLLPKKLLATLALIIIFAVLLIDLNTFYSGISEIKTRYSNFNLAGAINAIVSDNTAKEKKLIVLYQDAEEIGIANVSFFMAINDPELIYSVYWEDKAKDADYLITTGKKIEIENTILIYEPISGYPVYAYKKF